MKPTETSDILDFDASVLARWDLKPGARETLARARQTGMITPQEISEMVTTALAKDRTKMSEALQDIRKVLEGQKIQITFNVVQHTHSTTVVNQAPAAEKTLPAELLKVQQVPVTQSDSPFLNEKMLQEQGFLPEAFNILSTARMRGTIAPQEIGSFIPASISQDSDRLRTAMRWITQLLGVINVKIAIGSVHVKKAESTSPVTSYSVRPEKTATNSLREIFKPKKLEDDEEPSEAEFVELGNEEDAGEDFVPQFIFDKADGVTNPYYREVKDHKFLKHQDLLAISRRWHSHGDIEARNKIIVHNLRLSMKIAAHYMGRGLDYDDLVQEGNIGLVTAAERFDPEKGFHFSTYATWWVRQAIQRAVQNQKDLIRLPVHVNKSIHKILKITYELATELQREPMIEEIAARAGEDVDYVKKTLYRQKVPVVSLEEVVFAHAKSGNETTIRDYISDTLTLSPDQVMGAKEELESASKTVRTVLAAIKALPIQGDSQRFQDIFNMRFGLSGHHSDHTLESIGEVFGVTRERIRQIIVTIWKKIAEYGIVLDDDKFRAMLDKVYELESIVDTDADLITPENIILDEVALAFGDNYVFQGETTPGIIVSSGRPAAKIQDVATGDAQLQDIIRVVGDVYGYTPETILGEARPKEIVWARWVCTYIMREELKLSYVDIGAALNYADHTTVIYGYRSIKKVLEQDSKLREEVEKIITLCGFRKQKEVTPEQIARSAESVKIAADPIIAEILNLVCQTFEVKRSELLNKSNTRPDEIERYRILARNTAMYLLRQDFSFQCQEVAQVCGLDYSIASCLVTDLANQATTNPSLQEKLALIRGQYTLDMYGSDFEMLKRRQKVLFPKQAEKFGRLAAEAVKAFEEKTRGLHSKVDLAKAVDRSKGCFKARHNGIIGKPMATFDESGTILGVTRQRAYRMILEVWDKIAQTLESDDFQDTDQYERELNKVNLLVELNGRR